MLDLKINCAECGAENSVNEALSADLRAKMLLNSSMSSNSIITSNLKPTISERLSLMLKRQRSAKRGDEVDASGTARCRAAI